MNLVFFSIFLSGIFQVLMGMMRLGNLAKYCPYPVLSGLYNGGAVLIIAKQIPGFLGLAPQDSLRGFFKHLTLLQPLTGFVGLVTVVVTLFGDKITKKIPKELLGLIFGCVTYYVLLFLYGEGALGACIQSIPRSIPFPNYLLRFFSWDFFLHAKNLYYILIPAALSLALVNSLISLLGVVKMEELLKKSSDSKQELIAQGVGNMANAIFGGIAASGAVSRSIANFQAGGRTQLSSFFKGLFNLLIVVVLAPFVSYLPKVVIASILIVIAFKAFDRWSLTILKKLLQKGVEERREILFNLFVVLTVMFVLLFFDLFAAIFLGIFLSVAFFIARMCQGLVRQRLNGGRFRSRRLRSSKIVKVLEEKASIIQAFELQGSIFFGTADSLKEDVLEQCKKKDLRYIILDFKRVTELDGTGAWLIQQLAKQLREEKRHLLLSHINTGRKLGPYLKDFAVLDTVGKKAIFRDTNQALQWSEDQILCDELGDEWKQRELPIEKHYWLQGLSQEEFSLLKEKLVQVSFKKGETVFLEGDPGDSLYSIIRGSVCVEVSCSSEKGTQVIASFGKGMAFGEMALIDGQSRSARVTAQEDILCCQLSLENYCVLRDLHPHLISKVNSNFIKELSFRLRNTNRVVAQLDS